MDSKDCKLTLANAEVHEYMENESKQKKIITSKAYIQNKYSLQVIREKLCHVIHHHYFQIVVCVLVLLDTAVVVTEIMLETSNNTEGHPNPDVELAESVLHYTSLSILSFFMLEIIVKIFAMGLSILKHKLEIFDAVIVTVSFFLDLFLSPGGIKDGIEFLVLLRLWRITRIINGIIMSVKARAEEKEQKLLKEKSELEEKCSKLEMKIRAQQKDIDYLKERLKELGCNINTSTILDDEDAAIWSDDVTN